MQTILKKGILWILLLSLLLAFTGCNKEERQQEKRLKALAEAQMPDWIDVQIIGQNGVGRSGIPLTGMHSLVIHYIGNPGTTAQQNHDYFDKPETEVSSHFIVGLEGEIIQCVPLTEKSSASNDRNWDTVSIEVCHPDETGEFTATTYEALTRLAGWLCWLCDFQEENIIRHYDVTGKDCPRYFVQHEDCWFTFRQDVIAQKEAFKEAT